MTGSQTPATGSVGTQLSSACFLCGLSVISSRSKVKGENSLELKSNRAHNPHLHLCCHPTPPHSRGLPQAVRWIKAPHHSRFSLNKVITHDHSIILSTRGPFCLLIPHAPSTTTVDLAQPPRILRGGINKMTRCTSR